jgi:hypothetical protein
MIVHVDWCPFIFCGYLIRFSNVKDIALHTLEFGHHVEGFAISKSTNGIGQVGVRASE